MISVRRYSELYCIWLENLLFFRFFRFIINFSTKQKDDAESSGKTEDSLYQLLQEYMLENNKLKETNRSRLTSSSLIEKLASKTSQVNRNLKYPIN